MQGLKGLAGGLIGAFVGAIAGYFLFSFLLGSNLYAMLLPGSLVGLGCGALSRTHSYGLGVFAGCLGLALGVFLEWNFFPFADDDSLGYFLSNIGSVSTVSLLMIAGGGVLGFWFGKGRPEHAFAQQLEPNRTHESGDE